MTIEVIKPGLLTSLQDAGRSGLAHLGVGRAGAFDAPALRLANALCGNPRAACGLEMTLLGATLQCHAAALIAVTGAPLRVRINDSEAPMWAPLRVRAGATVTLGAMSNGCRAYLAVGGGFDTPSILGSRSTDINAGLGAFGGRPLRAGDVLPLATTAPTPPGRATAVRKWRLDPRPWYADDAGVPLRLLPGSQLENLAGTSRSQLFSQAFTVAADSNRTGLRLASPQPLEFDQPIEMLSEGCVPGLLQLPPSGQPIVLGPEGPVSGGYPRLGQIAMVDLPRLAQRRPGDALRFRPCTFDEARAALRDRERALNRLECIIQRRLKMNSAFRCDQAAAAPE